MMQTTAVTVPEHVASWSKWQLFYSTLKKTFQFLNLNWCSV